MPDDERLKTNSGVVAASLRQQVRDTILQSIRLVRESQQLIETSKELQRDSLKLKRLLEKAIAP